MLRPILRYGERPLHAPAAPVTRFDDQLQRLIDDMIETMDAAPGIGSRRRKSACRCACSSSISVGRDRAQLITREPGVRPARGTQLEEEGCLSVPGFNATVLRPSRVVIKASIARRIPRRTKAPDFSHARSSTKWTISTAASSSIASAASNATSSSGKSRSCSEPANGDEPAAADRLLRHA